MWMGPAAGDLANQDLVEHGGVALGSVRHPGRSREPPGRSRLEQFLQPRQFRRVGARDLVIHPGHDDGRPLSIVGDLVNSDADLGVGAHPCNLLSDGGEADQRALVRVEDERHWHHVRLVHSRTGQPADVHPIEDAVTFVEGQLVNDHGYSSTAMSGEAS